MNFLTKKVQMAKKGTNTMEEQEQLAAIAAKKNELTARRETLEQRIGSAQQQNARRYLAGDASGLEEGARLRAEVETIASALDLLGLDQRAAEADLLAANARDFRDQAAQKGIELAELNVKTAELLEKLSELENVTYTYSILSSQPLPGSWLQWATVKPPLEYQGIPELQLSYPTPDRKIEVPRSRRLRMEIADLEQQADKLEQKLRKSQPALAAT
jgi:hypothetical protein